MLNIQHSPCFTTVMPLMEILVKKIGQIFKFYIKTKISKKRLENNLRTHQGNVTLLCREDSHLHTSIEPLVIYHLLSVPQQQCMQHIRIVYYDAAACPHAMVLIHTVWMCIQSKLTKIVDEIMREGETSYFQFPILSWLFVVCSH